MQGTRSKSSATNEQDQQSSALTVTTDPCPYDTRNPVCNKLPSGCGSGIKIAFVYKTANSPILLMHTKYCSLHFSRLMHWKQAPPFGMLGRGWGYGLIAPPKSAHGVGDKLIHEH